MVADLLLLGISGVEAMSRAFILRARVGVLGSTLSSHNKRIGELDL